MSSSEDHHQIKHDKGEEKSSHKSAAHHHPNVRELSSKRLLGVLLLTGSFMIVEAVAGFVSGSLGLIADAGHMLGDVGALSLASFAAWLAARPSSPSSTYGFYRTEILAALANSVLMVVISVFIFVEAMQRLAQPPEIQSTTMLIVASLGLIINLLSLRLLSDNSKTSLNTRAAYLEIVSDLLASVGVIIAALIIMTTGFYLADPIISCLLALFILWRTWGLMKESVSILMECAPQEIDPVKLKERMLAAEGVLAVHDIHVWTITSNMFSMSAHVILPDHAKADIILENLRHMLDNEFGLAHSTIQLETKEGAARCIQTCSISDQANSRSKNQANSLSKNEANSLSKNEANSPSQNEANSPSQNEANSPSQNEANSLSKNEANSPSQDNTEARSQSSD